MSREQVYLGPILKKPLHRVKYVDDVLTVSSNHAGYDEGAAIQIEITNFGHADLKLATNLGNDGPHDGTLMFERMNITQQHVEFDPTNPHTCQSGTKQSS